MSLRRGGNNGDSLVFELCLWGLIPHWTKQPPDSASRLKTINARDDTILNGGMWTSIRGKKRAIVMVDGFYEWLQKGKDRLPHFTKRQDGRMMALAALWDSVTYEGENESIHSFTICTTESNKQLSFLHDRMPVILPDTEAMITWLDTSSGEWTSEHAKLLKPFEHELTCYRVAQEVGKVGNNSKDFVVPVAERKGNLHSFFAKQAASPKKKDVKEANDAPAVNSESNAPATSATTKPKRERSAEEAKPSQPAKKKAKKEEQPEVIDLDDEEETLEDAKHEMQKTGKLDAFVKAA